MLKLLVTANVPGSLIFLSPMMDLCSSETSVLTKATRRHISEDDTLHSHPSEKHNSYNLYQDCLERIKLR
jgi:hypothetical protein